MRLIILFLVVAVIAGCSAAGTTNVQKAQVRTTDVYLQSVDEVWNNAVEWFAVRNIPIDKLDKESGLITSEYGLGADQAIVNCGEPAGNIGLYKARFDGIFANVNVLIREREGSVRATINVFGRAQVVVRNAVSTVDQAATTCYSTGALEESFFAFMQPATG